MKFLQMLFKNICSEKKEGIQHKPPLWIIPFVIIDISIPVISVEALTPWIIGLLSSYITAKIAQRPEIKPVIKLLICTLISIISWAAYYAFYLSVKRYGFDGGFIPFIH